MVQVMKKLILILFVVLSPVFSYSQVIIPTFAAIIAEIKSGTIMPNNQFIDDFNNPQLANTSTYTASNPVNVQVGNVTYTVKTAKFTGWGDADPGYNVIEISKNNQIVFVHKQVDGLVNLYDNLYGQSLKPYSDNNFFIKAPFASEVTALIFAGWPYGGRPSQLLIIGLTPKDVKIVYNKNMDINSITQSGYNFSMEVQSNVLDDGQGTAQTHTIYQSNGVLYFQNN